MAVVALNAFVARGCVDKQYVVLHIARAHVVGALLAAQHGEAGLPKKWRKKAAKYMDVKQMAHVVVVQRTQFVPFYINRDPRQQPGMPKNATFV